MFKHTPVLLNETIDILAQAPGCRFVDATLGGGGHAEALLERRKDAQLIGLDRDINAIRNASERLGRFGDRFQAVHSNFSNLANAVRQCGWDSIDGVLMDIGVSSPQIDDPARGFSFRFDGPLDMRMNQEDKVTAADILNTASEKELEDIFRRYGEELKARRIAKEVVLRRATAPWKSTSEFAELLERIVGRAHQHGLPPATRCFQALRIAVNNELGELESALEQAVELTSIGGIIAVISFHSLEDRICKSFFKEQAATCVCPPGLPVCTCHKVQTLEILTKKPIIATEAEIVSNPRAACAKLRAAAVVNHITTGGTHQ